MLGSSFSWSCLLCSHFSQHTSNYAVLRCTEESDLYVYLHQCRKHFREGKTSLTVTSSFTLKWLGLKPTTTNSFSGWECERGTNTSHLWAELSTRTFDCSFEEDLAAPAGEDSIVTTWGLIRANHADFTPSLCLHSWRRSDAFLSVGGTGGGGYIPKLKTLHIQFCSKTLWNSIEIYLPSFLKCAYVWAK